MNSKKNDEKNCNNIGSKTPNNDLLTLNYGLHHTKHLNDY